MTRHALLMTGERNAA